MRALLRDVLERDGFHVHEHSAGDGLLVLLEDWIPDAIVLDKEMAGSNGLELLLWHRLCGIGSWGGCGIGSVASAPGVAGV